MGSCYRMRVAYTLLCYIVHALKLHESHILVEKCCSSNNQLNGVDASSLASSIVQYKLLPTESPGHLGFQLEQSWGMSAIRELSSLPLSRAHIDLLQSKGFRSISDLVGMRPLDLAEELGVDPAAATMILKAFESPMQLQPGTSARDLFRDPAVERHIVVFCKAVDALLGGGIPTGQLTELCGVPGIGKTQVSIQLALDVQIPEIFHGRGGEAVYIDTEGSFVAERAAGMARALERHIKSIARGAASDRRTKDAREQVADAVTEKSLLEGIYVFRAHDLTEQLAIINHLDAFALVHPRVKLVVLDSIAFHFRQETQSLASRGRVLSSLSQTLNELAFKHNLAVVVTNHVTTRIDPTNKTSQLVPALGEHWSHCVTNRLFLHWMGGVRHATLTKSPSRPPGRAAYVVSEDGVRGLSEHRVGGSGRESETTFRCSDDDQVRKRSKLGDDGGR